MISRTPDSSVLRAPSTGAGSLPRAQSLNALFELTKPSVTALVMVTMLCGALLAPGSIEVARLLTALFATACVVGAANTFNMWLERESDAVMSRTRLRPLPTGRITPELAVLFGSLLAVVGLTLLATLVSSLAASLAWFALTSYVLAYTPLKRVTPWSLHVGAVPGALPPLIGTASVSGALSREAIALFAILFVWQLPHFLAIATFRATEYARAGLKVHPNIHGVPATKRAILNYTLLLAVVAVSPALLGLASVTYGVIALASSMAFFAVALRGLDSEPAERWAKRLFLASMPYLVVVFASFVAIGN
jgi:protoheme IX farnesyltransferase